MKDLGSVTKLEQISFFKSFDRILCDVDGVLWKSQKPIPGAIPAINSLRKCGKKVIFVSNRTTLSHEDNLNNLNAAGFDIDGNDLIMPEVAVVSHLKSLRFDKEIFYLGMRPFREALVRSGFKIGEYPPQVMEESVPKFLKASLIDNPKIGAVVTDVDLNINYLKLGRAALYLKRPDVLFISANSSGKYLNAGPHIFNSWYFDFILEDFTGRRPLRFAKPSPEYNDFLKERHEIGDPARVLFIGDSVEEDLGFATNCGYQKMLVLSGMTTKETLHNWSFPQEFKPEYYVDSVKIIDDVLRDIEIN